MKKKVYDYYYDKESAERFAKSKIAGLRSKKYFKGKQYTHAIVKGGRKPRETFVLVGTGTMDDVKITD